MVVVGIPFTEEMYGMLLRESRRKNIRPETLLKVWILERVKMESNKHVIDDPIADVVSMPLKVGYILTASVTATVSALVEELVR